MKPPLLLLINILLEIAEVLPIVYIFVAILCVYIYCYGTTLPPRNWG
jgi:hypothetical protein